MMLGIVATLIILFVFLCTWITNQHIDQHLGTPCEKADKREVE